MIAEQMLEGSALYPAIDPEMLVTTGRIVGDNLAIGADFTNAYWLGWINFDNLPVDYRLSSFTINGDNITLADVTEQKNYDIGYTVGKANNPAYKAGVIRYDDENVRWVAWDRQEPDVDAQSGAMRLCNQVDINRQGLTRIVPIFAINPMNSGSVSQAYTMAFCVVDAPEFYRSDTWESVATIVDLHGVSGITGEVKFSASDLDGEVHTRILGGINCEYFCCGFQIENSNWTVYNANTQQYEFTNTQSTLRPFLALEANGYDGKFIINSAESPFNNGFSTYYGAGYAYNQRYGILWQYASNPYVYQTKPFNTDNLIAGNFVGSFSVAAVRDRFPASGVYGFYGVDGGNFVLQSTGYYEWVMIRRIYTLDEIRKTMTLYPRIINPGFADYVNSVDVTPSINDPIYARVSDTNEFVTETVSGYRECIFDLRPWQRINYKIQPDIAPYDNADKPPYTPGGDGTDNTNTGSDILLPTSLGVGGTNGFITQYALSAAQMQKIGELLWLTFTNPDYYKNFLFTLATTGTINLSNLLDYFVSLRVYPMPLINIPSYAAAGQDMYIGAGIVPLHFDSQLHTINNYADYVDAGTVYVPRYYGDFRDYDNTSIMLFLPYCGTVQLNPTDVIGGTLAARYAVDFATGGVTAYVTVTTSDGRTYPIATMAGSIGADIPLTATNATQIAARLAGDALHVAGIFGNAVETQMQREMGIAVNAASGNMAGALSGAVDVATAPLHTAGDVVSNALDAVSAPGTKMPMLSGGRGFGSFGQPQTAYIQIRRELYAQGQAAPAAYRHTYGNAVSKPVTVGSCSGFTRFDNIDTTGLDCTASERDQITALLQSGVYV